MQPVHGHSWRLARCGGRGGRPSRSGARRGDVGEGASVGPFCTFALARCSRQGAKAGTFVEIKNSVIGERTKSASSHIPRGCRRRCRYQHRRRQRSPPTRSTLERGKQRTAHRAQRQDAVSTISSSPRSRSATTHGWSRIRHNRGCPTEGRVAIAPRKAGEQGRTRWKPERLSRPCPGSRLRSSGGRDDDRARDPADAEEAADGVRGRSHPELAERIAQQLGVELGEIELTTFANGETYCPVLRVDSRRRRVRRPDRDVALSTRTSWSCCS